MRIRFDYYFNIFEMNADPLEGSSYNMDISIKSEIKEDDEEDNYNTMDLLELAQCVQTNQEPIEFNSTDSMMDPKTGLMVCLHCLEEFDVNMLTDHMVNAHNYRRVLYKCHICQNTFHERKLLLVHREDCRPPQKKKKKKKTFSQIMREVDCELSEDISVESITCPVCFVEMPKSSLKEHVLSTHKKPDIASPCKVCQRVFKNKLTLREHVKLVHEAVEDSEQCELCGQKFRSLKYLANHKRNVHPVGGKIHKCEICGKEFKSRLCLYQHNKCVHAPASAAMPCPHCGDRLFKSRANLHQHLRVSHGIKNPKS